jgi:hypothetical protein
VASLAGGVVTLSLISISNPHIISYWVKKKINKKKLIDVMTMQ